MTSNVNPDVKIVYQQGGAPPHTARKTQEWLIKNMPDLGGKFFDQQAPQIKTQYMGIC